MRYGGSFASTSICSGARAAPATLLANRRRSRRGLAESSGQVFLAVTLLIQNVTAIAAQTQRAPLDGARGHRLAGPNADRDRSHLPGDNSEGKLRTRDPTGGV